MSLPTRLCLRHLTGVPRTLHDVFVRRVIAVILALIVVLSLPARQARVLEREAPRPAAAGSAQSGQPPQAIDAAPQMIAGTAGSWQARLAHDAVASPSWSPRRPDYSFSVSVFSSGFPLHPSPSLRTFPLLI
jgi:hypothetical protein